jgi:hypothetical protein
LCVFGKAATCRVVHCGCSGACMHGGMCVCVCLHMCLHIVCVCLGREQRVEWSIVEVAAHVCMVVCVFVRVFEGPLCVKWSITVMAAYICIRTCIRACFCVCLYVFLREGASFICKVVHTGNSCAYMHGCVCLYVCLREGASFICKVK